MMRMLVTTAQTLLIALCLIGTGRLALAEAKIPTTAAEHQTLAQQYKDKAAALRDQEPGNETRTVLDLGTSGAVRLDFLAPAENPGTLGKLGHFDIVSGYQNPVATHRSCLRIRLLASGNSPQGHGYSPSG